MCKISHFWKISSRFVSKAYLFMHIKRLILEELKLWSVSETRKPLILKGARQVGKTTVLKQFGNQNFQDIAYFNFERQADLCQFFMGSKEPYKIIDNLSLVVGREIKPQQTLIIFDEIQECRDALISLKYFTEEAPEFSIIAAGSLLGLTLGHDRSFPVGKVEFKTLYPLTFQEFLCAIDQSIYEAYINFSIGEIVPLPEIFFTPLVEYFKQFLICGGMPEAAEYFIRTKDIQGCQDIQYNILRAYELDFAKHATGPVSNKIRHVWDSLPSQLAKENKKFLYQAVKSGARAREYETALTWLDQAGLISKVHKVSKPHVPLLSYADISNFKLYMLDVGLLSSLANLDPKAYTDSYTLFTEFKGAFIENYIAQALHRQLNYAPQFWTSEGRAEIDFIIQRNDVIVPVEVKSDRSLKSKSLHVFNERYRPKLRVRCSRFNLKKDGNLLNIPLFMADKILDLTDRGLEV